MPPSNMRRDRGVVAPKSAWTLFCEEQEQQQQYQQQSSSRSTRLPLHLANHPSFPLHLGVNALAGPAGSGKTQICLSLVADCVFWKLQQQQHHKAVFVSIGGKDTTVGNSYRLHSMLKHRKLKESRPSNNLNNNSNNNNNSKKIDEFIKQEYLSKIFVNWVRNQDDLLHMLHYTLPKLLKEHNASIVVLDGIATLFRGNQQDNNGGGSSGTGTGRSLLAKSSSNAWVDRSAKFFQIASQCQRLSFAHQVPFLFTNEATSKLNSSNGLLASKLEPALGLSWAQCINASYFVQRSASKRILKCIKSPQMATNATAEFAIEQRGTVRIMK